MKDRLTGCVCDDELSLYCMKWVERMEVLERVNESRGRLSCFRHSIDESRMIYQDWRTSSDLIPELNLEKSQCYRRLQALLDTDSNLVPGQHRTAEADC